MNAMTNFQGAAVEAKAASNDTAVDNVCQIVEAKAFASDMTTAQICRLAINLYRAFEDSSKPEHFEPAKPASLKGLRSPSNPICDPGETVFEDGIVCLENGKKYKMLKRHLREAYGMTPDEYRLKWNLPSDYPMAAPAFSRRKAQIARSVGLGHHPRHEREENLQSV